jgi:hypothetical protein
MAQTVVADRTPRPPYSGENPRFWIPSFQALIDFLKDGIIFIQLETNRHHVIVNIFPDYRQESEIFLGCDKISIPLHTDSLLMSKKATAPAVPYALQRRNTSTMTSRV